MSNMISRHFNAWDATCHCGCGLKIVDKKLWNMVEELRAYLCEITGRTVPIDIHCSVRCELHNADVGGEVQSRHLPEYHLKSEGAADLHAIGISNIRLRHHARKLWKDKKILTGGLGCYTWGIHIDNSTRRRWGLWI
jgi:uncharacterized protein YcbK (DUF882 family)